MSFDKSFGEATQAFEKGLYFECANLLRAIIEDADAGALTNEQQAKTFLDYGRVLWKLARYQESNVYLTKAKSLYETAPGVESYEYSGTLYEFGMLAYEQYQLSDARKYFEETLQLRKTLFTAPHKDIAQVLDSLGEVEWKDGNDKTALPYLDEALEMQKQTVGEMTNEYAGTLVNRGLVMARSGHQDEAEAALRRSLVIRTSCLPPEHPSIANSLANLAYILQQQGKEDGVEEMKKRSLEILIKSYGEKHPHTAVTINNMGGFYLDKGNLLEAVKCFERALSIKERVLGKDSPGLMKNIYNLSIVYHRLGRIAEAQQLRKRSDALMKDKIASSNEKDIDTMIRRADRLLADKQPAEARAILAQALDVATKEFGADSLKAAHVLGYTATDLRGQGDFGKAADCLGAVLRIRKRQLGAKHAQVAETLRLLAACLTNVGLNDVSTFLIQQAQVIEKRAGIEDPQIAAMLKSHNEKRDRKGPKDPSVILSMRMISLQYQQRGHSDAADKWFDDYVTLKEEQGGDANMSLARELSMTALSIHPIGILVLREVKPGTPDLTEDFLEKDVRKGIRYLEKAIAILDKADDEEEKDFLIETLGFLASAQRLLKNLDSAERHAQRAIDMLEKKNGDNHWSLRIPLRQLGEIFDAQERKAEREAILKRIEGLEQATPAQQSEMTKKRTQRSRLTISTMLRGL